MLGSLLAAVRNGSGDRGDDDVDARPATFVASIL
jgi:hypothetical protein